MRFLMVLVALLTGFVPLFGEPMSFSFSGVWAAGNVTALGLLEAGDPFSGSLTWDPADTTNDPCPNPAFSRCPPLSSLTLSLPADTGLSISSPADLQGAFEIAWALYPLGDPNAFLNFQINRLSSVDNQYYIFGFFVGTGGGFGGAYVADATFTNYLTTIDYTSTGPVPVSEPAEWTLFALVCFVLSAAFTRSGKIVGAWHK